MKPRSVRYLEVCTLMLLSLSSAWFATAHADNAAVLKRGEAVYERCAGCHSIEANRTGPQHCGLFGRRAGTAPGYDNYSPALRNSKIIWNEKTLDTFLTQPMKAVPGTSMGYAGISDAGERADLIAWLRSATRAGQACQLSR